MLGRHAVRPGKPFGWTTEQIGEAGAPELSRQFFGADKSGSPHFQERSRQ